MLDLEILSKALSGVFCGAAFIALVIACVASGEGHRKVCVTGLVLCLVFAILAAFSAAITGSGVPMPDKAASGF